MRVVGVYSRKADPIDVNAQFFGSNLGQRGANSLTEFHFAQ